MIKNYIKIAIRNLLKQKIFSFINIAGLAIGMACVVLIFLWIKEETSYDNFHIRKDQIHRVIIDLEKESQATVCGALGPTAKEEIPEVLDYTRIWGGWENQLYYEENYTKEKGSFADPSIFTTFTFPLIEGDPKTALLESHTIVIKKSVSTKLFGKESALGKMVQIKNRSGNKESFKITGIMKEIPRNSHIQFDFLFSFNLLKEWYRPKYAESWTNFSFFTYLLVQKESSPDINNKKLTDCFNNHKDTKRNLHIEPLNEVYLNAEILNLLGPSGNRLYVMVFSLIAFLVLIIACINYMNLATAKAVTRAKEVGLRKVIGAGKMDIIFQNFGESILITLLSFPLTLFLIELISPIFNKIVGKELFINYMNPQIILGLLGLLIITGMISGIYPALYISSFTPADILKKRAEGRGSRNSLRKILVVFQFSLTIIIIISALVISAQMKFIQNKNLGFEEENLLYAWVPGKNNDVLKTELIKNPNILNVGASGAQLDWLGWWAGINKWDGKENKDHISFGILEVGYDYLDTYKMEIIEGRYYSEKFANDLKDSIVLNQSAVELMNLANPIGKSIYYNKKKRKIIGIVKNFHFGSLHEKIGPILFVLYPKQLRCLGIRISGNNVPATIAHIKNVFATHILDEKIELKFLDDQLNQLYKSETLRATLFSYFSFISILLASLGLFGLTTFTVERKTKEIGIRKVLGASISKIIFTLSKEFLLWILIANIIAAPITYYMMRKWLQNFAYKINLNIGFFLLAGISVLITALLIVGYQAIKAAQANPVDSLSYE